MPEIDFAQIVADDAAQNNDVAPPADVKPPGALTEETAEPVAAPGDEPPATETPPEPVKAEGIPVERFKSETAKRRAAERENRELREKLALRSAPEVPAGELHPSKFATIEEYGAAVKKQAQADAQAEVRAEVAARKQADFRSRLEKEGKDIEDFDEVISTVFEDDKFPISVPMAEYLLDDADNPALMAKWLADNPDDAKRIAAMRPTAATKEMVRRDGLLGRKATPPVTRAPAPTPSVSGSGTARQSIETMPMADLQKMVSGWTRNR